MPRPFTRDQHRENHAFLRALARTGNIRLAAREIGIAYGTVQHRRRHHPAFAQAIDVALVFAEAQLHEAGGLKRPIAAEGAKRTAGGEPVVVCRRDGKLQMRAAQPGKLTKQCEQAFLAALSATANVRWSAAAAGASVAAFYRRRRQNPAFAREMRLALEMGYDRIELALLESWMPEAQADDAWRHNDPPPIPMMSANQALQLLYLHQKETRLRGAGPDMKIRRGETIDIWSARRAAAYRAELAARAEDELVRKVLSREPARVEQEEAPVLPALDQVTGWSKADTGRAAHHEDVALFGGWRLKDWEKENG